MQKFHKHQVAAYLKDDSRCPICGGRYRRSDLDLFENSDMRPRPKLYSTVACSRCRAVWEEIYVPQMQMTRVRCPSCGALDLIRADSRHTKGDRYIAVQCEKCGVRREESYVLYTIDLQKPPSKNDRVNGFTAVSSFQGNDQFIIQYFAAEDAADVVAEIEPDRPASLIVAPGFQKVEITKETNGVSVVITRREDE
ncbi:MAG: hypothetical protein ACOC7M_02415 [Chloroflexota bacterium]